VGADLLHQASSGDRLVVVAVEGWAPMSSAPGSVESSWNDRSRRIGRAVAAKAPAFMQAVFAAAAGGIRRSLDECW
jgi:hypothetical protein